MATVVQVINILWLVNEANPDSLNRKLISPHRVGIAER